MELLKVKIGDNEFTSNQVTMSHRPASKPMMVIYLVDVSLDSAKDIFSTIIPDSEIEVYGSNGLEGKYTGYRFNSLSFLSLSTRDAGNTYESEVSVTLEKMTEV